MRPTIRSRTEDGACGAAGRMQNDISLEAVQLNPKEERKEKKKPKEDSNGDADRSAGSMNWFAIVPRHVAKD